MPVLDQPPSPTGTPILSARWTPYVLAFVGALTILEAAFNDPSPWTPQKIIHVVTLILTLAAVGAMPGWRSLPAILLALCLLTPAPASAQVDWSHGPSVPLVEVRLDGSTVQLGGGAGYQLGAGFFPTVIQGKSFDLLGIGLVGFGQVGPGGGSASLALTVSTLQGLLSLGFGCDAVAVSGGRATGFLAGKVGAGNLFGLLSLAFNLSGGPVGPALAGAPPPGNTLLP